MQKLRYCALGLSLAVAGLASAAAQQQGEEGPPKVLQITREYTKPYKGGMSHDKTETAFVQAMKKANWPTHYLGMTSLSGRMRALYMTPFVSFAAWEKDNADIDKNKELAAALESAALADGELLDEVDQGVFVYSESSSYHPKPDIANQRFLEITAYQVKPGHSREWDELVTMVKGAYEKSGMDGHWAIYRQAYGGPAGRYLVVEVHRSLAEIDSAFLDDDKFAKTLGDDGLKRLDELIAAAIESSEHNLYQFNPHMSYVSDEWAKSDATFWNPGPPAKEMAEEEKSKP